MQRKGDRALVTTTFFSPDSHINMHVGTVQVCNAVTESTQDLFSTGLPQENTILIASKYPTGLKSLQPRLLSKGNYCI